MGKDNWRRAQEEMHRANWDGIRTWLDKGGSRSLRSRVMRNSARIMIGDALHEISLREGLAFLRPELIDAEEELYIQAQNADRDRLQGMADHPTSYKLLELDLGLKISLLVPGELKVNKNIKGGNSNNTHFQARLIVGEKLAELVDPQG